MPDRAVIRVAGILGALWMVSAPRLPAPAAFAGQSPAAAPECRPAGTLARLAELPEASGLAASRAVEGRLWAHNDSGEPVIFALDVRGSVTARVTVTGAKVEDWEAISVGACPAGSCIYVADIGDNDAERERITIYRMAEPETNARSTAPSEAIHATYPDGPHDAEALLVGPEGRLFIVTKGDTGPVALYAFPRELRAGSTVKLERVGQPREKGKPSNDDRITDGSVSPDGRWVVLRTNGALSFHPSANLFAGNWTEERRASVAGLNEPQGEAVAFGTDGTIYLAGEGGGKSRPGTLARLSCSQGR